MEGDTKKFFGVAAAFALGAITMGLISKYMSSSSAPAVEEETIKPEQAKEKKVTFGPEVLQHEELKDIINLAMKETLEKMMNKNEIKNEKMRPILKHANEPKARRRYSENEEPIYKICFTGGPCAGKTTALSSLISNVAQLGFRPFLVPEAATTLMKAGFLIDNAQFTEMEAIQFQSSLMRLQIFLEDITLEYAAATSNKPVVIFCDRGLMDGKAYVSEKVWQAILDEMGWNEIYLRDSRYDAVIHMVTAADGAEKYYDLDTNEARYEDLEKARVVDQSLQKHWSGHSQLCLIDNNCPSFDEKIKKAERTVLNLLGIPQTTIFNCKYLIYPYKKSSIHVPYEEFEVEEYFLTTNPNQQAKLIKKGTMSAFTYTLETKDFTEDQVITRRRQITAREFLHYYQDKLDHSKVMLVKKRMSFMYRNQHFIIDTFKNIDGKPSLLRIETEVKSEDIEKPVFLKYFREVTDEEEYSTYNMADKSYKLPEKDAEALRVHKLSHKDEEVDEAIDSK